MSTGRRLFSGLEILEDVEGSGIGAQIGDTVVYNVRIFLNRGDEVAINERQAEHGIEEDRLRRYRDRLLVDHVTRLGSREAIAGIESALVGMSPGGYRKLRVGPHLAYRERGVPGLIPPNAVLTVEVWVRGVR